MERNREEAPHGDESVESLLFDEVFYHAGDMTVSARPDSGKHMHHGPCGSEPASAMTLKNRMRTTHERKIRKTSVKEFGTREIFWSLSSVRIMTMDRSLDLWFW